MKRSEWLRIYIGSESGIKIRGVARDFPKIAKEIRFVDPTFCKRRRDEPMTSRKVSINLLARSE